MTRAAVVGLGDIGIEIARTASMHASLDVVAAVDIDPGKAGEALRTFTRLDGSDDVRVTGDLRGMLESARPDVVLLSTGSRMDQVATDIRAAVDAGASVVTTSEEMTWPWNRSGAEEIHRAAVAAGCAVLGVGVNPGFVMDLLPSVLATASLHVDRVAIERRVDLTRRRPALQQKAGVGLKRDEFVRLADAGRIGHVGLDSSACLVASSLGLVRDLPLVEIEPIIVDSESVVGFRQRTGWARTSSSPGIELSLEMSVLLEEEFDRVEVTGEPAFTAVIDGGISGDVATAALVVNAIPLLVGGRPGLKTVLDLPPLRGWLSPT